MQMWMEEFEVRCLKRAIGESGFLPGQDIVRKKPPRCLIAVQNEIIVIV
jgi:hypothetical protein